MKTDGKLNRSMWMENRLCGLACVRNDKKVVISVLFGYIFLTVPAEHERRR